MAVLYEQMDGIGTVKRTARLPDRITAQARQVHVWLEIEAKGHSLTVLADTKFRDVAVDVKDVEEVYALAQAIGADNAVLVTTQGWSDPVARKPASCSMDLRHSPLEDVLNLVCTSQTANV